MPGGLAVDTAPDVGQLVRVRGQQWVVNRRSVSTQPRDELAAEVPGRTLVTLTSVSDDDLGVFLDAVRWGTLQAPFRAGTTIEDYQLEPVAKAPGMPRVTSWPRWWSKTSRKCWISLIVRSWTCSPSAMTPNAR